MPTMNRLHLQLLYNRMNRPGGFLMRWEITLKDDIQRKGAARNRCVFQIILLRTIGDLKEQNMDLPEIILEEICNLGVPGP